MHQVTILGSGRVARTLAAKLSIMGHSTVIGTRDPVRAAADWAAPHIRFARHSEAVKGASMVVNATPGATSLACLATLRDELASSVLLDVANATERGPDGAPAALMYPNDSLAERLQRALPETRVVKALNTMAFMVMADPRSVSNPPTVFLSGNDESAKAAVCSLLLTLGWKPDWVQDLGDITTARATEAVVLLAASIVRKYGFAPFAISLAR